MALVTIRTVPLTAVAIGGNHDFKDEAIAHLVATVIDSCNVVTACGSTIEALPSTWQKSRPCRRCPPAPAPMIVTELGFDDDLFGTAVSFLELGSERRRRHALYTIRNSPSIRLAQIVARRIGYDPPSTIVEDHPDLARKVTYVRKDMQKKYGINTPS